MKTLFLALLMFIYLITISVGGFLVVDVYLGASASWIRLLVSVVIGLGWIVPIGLLIQLSAKRKKKG